MPFPIYYLCHEDKLVQAGSEFKSAYILRSSELPTRSQKIGVDTQLLRRLTGNVEITVNAKCDKNFT